MLTNPKEKYRQFCREEPSIPIFSRDWWLDATAGKDYWDVVLVEKGGQVAASLPFTLQRQLGFLYLTQPPLTQTLGPWLRATSAKYTNRLAQEKELMGSLIDQLPKYHCFSQNWRFTNKNWLPFYWRGFSQTTRYTYRLPDLGDEEVLWEQLRENIRRNIRKAQKRFSLKVRNDLGLNEFMELNKRTFKRQGMKLPYSLDYVEKLDNACLEHKARMIFIAEDAEGLHHAGVYLIWDQNSAYYLMGGGDPLLRGSGATSLCLWEAIRFASTVTKSFDFEGSMIESVERYFRSFGAIQTPYFNICSTPSRILRVFQALRSALYG